MLPGTSATFSGSVTCTSITATSPISGQNLTLSGTLGVTGLLSGTSAIFTGQVSVGSGFQINPIGTTSGYMDMCAASGNGDYDVRFWCIGGNSTTSGTGQLQIVATSGLSINGPVVSSGLNVTGSCIINGADRLNFPTTNSGGNTGLDIYWNKSGGNGETDYIARGQGGGGGHYFYTSNVSTPPILNATIDDAGNVTAIGRLSGASLSIAGDSSLQEINTPNLITYNNVLNSSSLTRNNTGLAFTISTSSHYIKTLTFKIPINVVCTALATGRFGLTIASLSFSVYRNGTQFVIPFMTYTGNSGYGGPLSSGCTSLPASFEFFRTEASFSFTSGDFSTASVYTGVFVITFTDVTNCTPEVYVNSTVSTQVLNNCSAISVGQPSTGYVAGNFIESSLAPVGGRIGQTEVCNLTVSSNAIVANALQVNGSITSVGVTQLQTLNYRGMAGCYMIDGAINAFPWPIYYSCPDLTNAYNLSSSSSVNPTVGSKYGSTISLDNRDDYWIVMPGYRLKVFHGTSYTSNLLLDMNNTDVVPIYCVPFSVNLASSVQLYYNGILL